MRFAIALALTGCWRGDPPAPPPSAPPRSIKPPDASVRSVRCEDGRTLVILSISKRDAGFTIEIPLEPGAPIPKAFDDGDGTQMSPCLHGCSPGHLELDALVIGKRAHGRYQINANAGPQYEGEFEASWIGTPWQLDRCEPEI